MRKSSQKERRADKIKYNVPSLWISPKDKQIYLLCQIGIWYGAVALDAEGNNVTWNGACKHAWAAVEGLKPFHGEITLQED